MAHVLSRSADPETRAYNDENYCVSLVTMGFATVELRQGADGNRPATHYSITPAGHEALAAAQKEGKGK